MTAEEGKASGLRSKMHALKDKCSSANVKAFADMLATIALAERSIDLERASGDEAEAGAG